MWTSKEIKELVGLRYSRKIISFLGEMRDYMRKRAKENKPRWSDIIQETMEEFGRNGFKKAMFLLYAGQEDGGMGLSTHKIAEEMLGVREPKRRVPAAAVISRWLKRLGIGLRPPKWIRVNSEFGLIKDSCYVRHDKRVEKVPLTNDLAYIGGFSIGDGYINPKRGVFSVFNSNFGLLPKLKRIMTALSSTRRVYERYYYVEKEKYPCPCTKEEANYWGLTIYSVIHARLFTTEEGLNWKNINYILRDPNYTAIFLAGLWDADGTIRDKNAVLSQNEDRKELLERIKEILMKHYTIKTGCVRLERKKEKCVFRIEGKVCRAKKDIYALTIIKESFDEWAEAIGKYMKHPDKVRKIRLN